MVKTLRLGSLDPAPTIISPTAIVAHLAESVNKLDLEGRRLAGNGAPQPNPTQLALLCIGTRGENGQRERRAREWLAIEPDGNGV